MIKRNFDFTSNAKFFFLLSVNKKILIKKNIVLILVTYNVKVKKFT